MQDSISKPSWGQPPWTIDFHPVRRSVPEQIDFAVVGGGFTGLAAAAWLRLIAPDKSVALFESRSIGAGSSGFSPRAENALGRTRFTGHLDRRN